MCGKRIVSLVVIGFVSALFAFGIGFLFVGPNMAPQSGRAVAVSADPSSVEARAASDRPTGPVVVITPCPLEPPASTSPPPRQRATQRHTTAEAEAVAESEPDPTPSSLPEPNPGLYRVTTGEFDSQEDARSLQRRLAAEGHECALVTIYRDGGPLYSVQVGAFSRSENARSAAEAISKRGYDAHVDAPY